MKILITGSNGFIGKSVATSLKYQHTIVGQGRASNCQKMGVQEYFELAINSKSNWEECLLGVNVIIHLAAVAHNNSNDPDYINEVNVKGTINLAQQAADAGVKRFIFISSIGVLGNKTLNNERFNEQSPISVKFEYTQSKAKAEVELIKIAEKTGLEIVIIRPVLVYGVNAPGNFGSLVKIVNKLPILPFGLCKNKRSFISIDNIVDFISVCIEHPRAKNEIFCISDGQDISIKELTNATAKGLNKKLWQLPVPDFIFGVLKTISGKQDKIDQLVGDLQVDSSKARKLLNWTPPFSMAETLQKLSEK
ncbi:NAD-dependent epimerase/dehydratase family protein [Aliivibrio logei]|uniref:UDP-glucose 4-epimerase n=1 Tax=Aliivibrio logei TaxID=688 RepID=A0A1B9NVD9_ALILO|nr:NAD-dependent epimerase/dehydratase family protein [Aliivibrio logei]OCH18560.1 UDP-glucose 4-epimerase [Aliivibrio logei]